MTSSRPRDDECPVLILASFQFFSKHTRDSMFYLEYVCATSHKPRTRIRVGTSGWPLSRTNSKEMWNSFCHLPRGSRWIIFSFYISFKLPKLDINGSAPIDSPFLPPWPSSMDGSEVTRTDYPIVRCQNWGIWRLNTTTLQRKDCRSTSPFPMRWQCTCMRII